MQEKKLKTTVTQKPPANPTRHQTLFLNKLIKAKTPVSIEFSDSTKKAFGNIVAYDQFNIIVMENNVETMLFKHDIRLITPIKVMPKKREILSLNKTKP